MTPEQKFWQLLKPHIPGHVQRIENSTSVGIPDVNFAYNGKETWLELKAGSKLRDSQKIWHQQRTIQGSRVLVVERLGDIIYISKPTGNEIGEYSLLWKESKPWSWKLIVGVITGEGIINVRT